MKAFMDKEFMLQSPVAQHLYHTYAADMPICDYHMGKTDQLCDSAYAE